MEDTTAANFLEVWHQIMIIGSILCVILALVIYFIHKIKVASIDDYKAKYDYINANEITYYRVCLIIIGVAVALFINTYGQDDLKFHWLWFSVRIFIAIAGGTLVGYIGSLILQYYYPTRLHKKLKKYRFTPRINPVTGNKMRLLSESEEDVHLDEGMIAEENVFSVDYDVWIDDATGETKIEKYAGHLQALQCNNCGFYTMKVQREEIVKNATETENGELIKYYECQYCQSTRATQFQIIHSDDAAQLANALNMNKTGVIELISIDVRNSDGVSENFQFQNIDQAKNFLDQYNMSETQ